jgi:hypothetical protein
VALETKSTFLSTQEWKTLPFTKLPKTPLQRVIDLLLEAPVIQTRVDKLPALQPSEHVPVLISIIEHCLAVDEGMQDLYLDLESSVGSPIYWPNTSIQPGDVDALFPDSFVFPDYRTGTTMMLSWATLTILWSGICHLYRYVALLTPLTPTASGKLTGSYVKDGQTHKFEIPTSARYEEFPTMARNVCKSVEFCMQDELGLVTLACPLMMVVEALGSWPGFEGEIWWAKERLRSVKGRGMKIAEFTN